MIERHHPTRPLKTFRIGIDKGLTSTARYRFTKSTRNCWIWHCEELSVSVEHRYIVQCPDGFYYSAKNLTEAQTIAGRWANGADPKPEVIQ